MSSITGRANLLLTTSIGGGVYAGIKNAPGRERYSVIMRPYFAVNAAGPASRPDSGRVSVTHDAVRQTMRCQ